MDKNYLVDVSEKYQKYLDLCRYYNIPVDPMYINIDKYIEDNKDAIFKLELINNKLVATQNIIDKKREITVDVLSNMIDLYKVKYNAINQRSKSFQYITDLCVLYAPNISVRSCIIKISKKYNVTYAGINSTIKNILTKWHPVIPTIIPNYSPQNVSISAFVAAMYLYINEKLKN